MVSHLVTTAWLADHLNDDNLRVYDCTAHFSPDFRVIPGAESYAEGHIPGAAFLDIMADFSDHDSPLMFTLPAEAAFAEALGRAGIDPALHIVLYTAADVMFATRFWWMLRAYGLRNVSVLDGGLAKWRDEGRPVSQTPVHHPPTTPAIALDRRLLATTEDVQSLTTGTAGCIVDALPSQQFNAGHIPGSRNLPFMSLMDVTGEFLPPSILRDQIAPTGALDAEHVVTYCGGGIAATVAAFALALVGREDVAVYDGSMQAWRSNPDNPVETDAG